jgi:hypothetical protein
MLRQVIPKVNCPGSAGSTVILPLVPAFSPASQILPWAVGSPPPVSAQLCAFVDVQLIVYACPVVTVDAELEICAVGAGGGRMVTVTGRDVTGVAGKPADEHVTIRT